MKKIFILIAFVCSTALCSNLYAQQVVTPPSVSGDKNLRDMNIKSRAADLDRVERDARKNDKSTGKKSKANQAEAEAEDKLAAKYAEIKTDFEQIQKAQDSIIKAYQGSGKIDYALISKSALEINGSAKRLDSNLFPPPPTTEVTTAAKSEAEKEEKKADKAEQGTKPAKSVRDLIIDMDEAIAAFVLSPMFKNLRVVDAEVSAKAKLDLGKIIELSVELDRQAQKMDASEK